MIFILPEIVCGHRFARRAFTVEIRAKDDLIFINRCALWHLVCAATTSRMRNHVMYFVCTMKASRTNEMKKTRNGKESKSDCAARMVKTKNKNNEIIGDCERSN